MLENSALGEQGCSMLTGTRGRDETPSHMMKRPSSQPCPQHTFRTVTHIPPCHQTLGERTRAGLGAFTFESPPSTSLEMQAYASRSELSQVRVNLLA